MDSSTTATGTFSATTPPSVPANTSTTAGVGGGGASSMTSGPRKVLHSKRSFGTKHSLAHNRPVLDSPAYDASEEDNDPLTDDGSSSISIPLSAHAHASHPPRGPNTSRSGAASGAGAQRGAVRPRHALAANVVSSDEGGIDSPTYDGDVESIHTTRGPGRDTPGSSTRYASSIASTLTSPLLPSSVLHESDDPGRADGGAIAEAPPLVLPPSAMADHDNDDDNAPARSPAFAANPALAPSEPPPASIAVEAFNPANLTPGDIQEHARACIAGTDAAGRSRQYRINAPPTDRAVRIYADGVYDLFHFGHALQLRQAKLAFPAPPDAAPHVVSGVHLLVGVNSDEQCEENKNIPIMRHAERCEAVRHCRWVDEVVPEAPWVIDAAFIEKYQIDYVAHDEDPYASTGHDDVYHFAKSQGKFLPTRRTPGVSTSELLERIVSGYRHRLFDKKLLRMGHAELMAEGSDYDDSAPPSGRVSPSRR